MTIVNHRHAVRTALDIPRLLRRRLCLLILFDHAVLDDLSYPRCHASAKDELRFLRHFPHPQRLVSTACTDRYFAFEAVNVVNAILMTEERLDVGERGEIEYFQGSIVG